MAENSMRMMFFHRVAANSPPGYPGHPRLCRPDDFDGIVYDVGGGMFDHHSEPRECRPNGVPYAAFGLLWRVVGFSSWASTRPA